MHDKVARVIGSVARAGNRQGGKGDRVLACLVDRKVLLHWGNMEFMQ